VGPKEEKPTIRSPARATIVCGSAGVGGVEVVPADPLLRLQRVEELVADQAAVGDLPGADVDARDVKTLVRPGGSD